MAAPSVPFPDPAVYSLSETQFAGFLENVHKTWSEKLQKLSLDEVKDFVKRVEAARDLALFQRNRIGKRKQALIDIEHNPEALIYLASSHFKEHMTLLEKTEVILDTVEALEIKIAVLKTSYKEKERLVRYFNTILRAADMVVEKKKQEQR